MGAQFTPGERKIRPGAYYRMTNAGTRLPNAAPAGIAAAMFKATWGPLGVAQTITNAIERAKIYGIPDANNNADVIDYQLMGGVKKTVAIRLGTGGTKGTLALKDSADATVVTGTAMYPGNRSIKLTIRDCIVDATKREIIITPDGSAPETFTFAKGAAGEVDALVAATANSEYVTFTKGAAGTGLMKAIADAPLAGGANPAIATADYTNAASVIEGTAWDVLSTDSVSNAVNLVIQAYIDRIIGDGKFTMAVVTEAAAGVNQATRLTSCAAFDDKPIIYVVNGYTDIDGNDLTGYKSAAVVAGMIASTPSNRSLTHAELPLAAGLTETLTGPQIEAFISAGGLVLSTSAKGKVQIDYAINTLVTLAADEDAGWKKIRRVKTRYELMQRVGETNDALIGQVDNNADGQAALISAAQGVIGEMIKENKLISGSVMLDPENPPEGDSVYYAFDDLQDLDSQEKMYCTFKFKYSS